MVFLEFVEMASPRSGSLRRELGFLPLHYTKEWRWRKLYGVGHSLAATVQAWPQGTQSPKKETLNDGEISAKGSKAKKRRSEPDLIDWEG